MKLVLYGSGKRSQILMGILKDTYIDIVAVVDSNKQKCGGIVKGYEIEPVESLPNYTEYYICVTFYSSAEYDPVWERLTDIGFERNRVLSFNEVLLLVYRDIVQIKKVYWGNNESKIIFDGSWELKLGGVESWLKTIVPALRKSGLNNVYLATELKSQQIDADNILNFCLYDTPVFSKKYIDQCIEFLYSQLPCIITFSRVNELLLAATLIKERNPAAIHIIMADHGSCDGMYRDILSYRDYIDYYVCVSTGIKERIICNGINPQKVDVMTCPVLFDSVLQREYTLCEVEPIRIGFAGRLEIFEKRIDMLKSVIACLERKRINYVMKIAGMGTEFESLSAFIQENNLEKKIQLLGQLPNDAMAAFWKEQDIALNTSDNEGRPLSNMEAMISGAVPVVTHTIGILDDVKDGINGFIVPIDDAEMMSERITYLYNNRKEIEKMGKAARKELIQKTNLDNHVIQWRGIFERIGAIK